MEDRTVTVIASEAKQLLRRFAPRNGERKHAPRTVHDAGASARARAGRHARRGRGEGALCRPARFRRIVARRTFLRDHRAHCLAADVHGRPGATHQKSHLRHRGDLPAEPSSDQSGGRGGAIRPYEPRPVHARHRHWRALFGFRIVRQRRPQGARAQSDGIDRHDRAHLAQDPPYELKGQFWNVQLKDAIIPELGIGFMPKPYRKGGPPISMSVSSRNSPTARVAAQRGWGIISANNVPRPALPAHWGTYSKACADAGKPARGENWRVARNVTVAASENEARDRVFSEHGSNRYFYTYMREVL